MVAGMDLNVTADEAGILRDFFRVQSDKHGPELLSRLNNIQYGEREEEKRREGPVKMEQVVEEVIQQEIQAEAALRNSSPGSECSSEGPGPVLPEHMALAFGPPGARAMGPWLLGPGGLVLPLPLHEQTALGELLRLQQGGGVSPPPSDRHLGVSVIQKAPAARSPRLYLERRETLSPSPHPAPLQLLKRKVERREEVVGGGPVAKRRSNQQQSDHLICEVCGERAGKHSYYGGQVCPSCRAFFRRSVQSRYNETFKCTKGMGDCEISLITRKNCQFCRYQRCIGAGMRPSWILSDEERVRRFHGRNKAVKTERAGSPTEGTSPESRSTGTNSPLLVSPSRSPNPSTSLVEEERGKILSYGEVMLRSLAGRQEQVERTLLTDLLQVSVHGTSLSTKTAQQLSALLDRRTLAGLAALPEFQGLPAAAQAQVVEHNLPLVHRFRQAVCLSNPELTWRRLIGFLVGEEKLQSCEEDLPCDLSGKKSPGSTMMYSSLLSSASCNARPELEQAHLNLVKELAASLDLDDEVQVILTVLIITFCPDFLDLGERSAVEQAQLKFVLLLQSHLATSSPSLATARLAKTLMVPAIARQVHQLARERLII